MNILKIAIAKSKARTDFYTGMILFKEGYSRPIEDTAKRLGWDAALEMNKVERKYLEIAEQRAEKQSEEIEL